MHILTCYTWGQTDTYTYRWIHLHMDTSLGYTHGHTHRDIQTQTHTQMDGHTQTHRYAYIQMHTWTYTNTWMHTHTHTYTTTVFHGVIFPQPTSRLPLAPGSAPCLSFKLEQVTKHSVSVPSGVERFWEAIPKPLVLFHEGNIKQTLELSGTERTVSVDC